MTELTDEQLAEVARVVTDLLAAFTAEAVSALEAEVASLRHQLDLWNPGRLPFDSSRNLRH